MRSHALMVSVSLAFVACGGAEAEVSTASDTPSHDFGEQLPDLETGWPDVERTHPEREPNNILDDANDVGLLVGRGSIDHFQGTIEFASDEAGYEHDDDVFVMWFYEDAEIDLSLDWDGTYDLDAFLLDADGDELLALDGGEKPEVGGSTVSVSTGNPYYVLVRGYEGAEGKDADYVLTLGRNP